MGIVAARQLHGAIRLIGGGTAKIEDGVGLIIHLGCGRGLAGCYVPARQVSCTSGLETKPSTTILRGWVSGFSRENGDSRAD